MLLRSTTTLGMYILWPRCRALNTNVINRSLYTKLLNNPSAYGFTDVDIIGGSFWHDAVHPRTKVHQYMAADLATFLQNQVTGAMNPVAPSAAIIATTSTTMATSAPTSTSTGTVPNYGQW